MLLLILFSSLIGKQVFALPGGPDTLINSQTVPRGNGYQRWKPQLHGTYFLTVNNPANGCTAVASVTVTADFTECSMIAPKQTIGHAASLNNASTGNTAAGSGLIYKVYPNPVNTTAFVNLTSPERKHVSVEIYNSVGIREKVLFDGTVEAGIPYQWTLDASRFAAGIHYCIIRTNNKSYTSKLLISSGRP